MKTMRELTDKELDAVCGGGHRSSGTTQLNFSHNFAVVANSRDTNIIQGSNINGFVVQVS
jgi:hypothetical protein